MFQYVFRAQMECTVVSLNAVIIVAAGRGIRTGFAKPKQYIKMQNGLSVLENTLNIFTSVDCIDLIVPVICDADKELYSELSITDNRITKPVIGGQSRAESVLNGLQSLRDSSPKYVLIHDAARPFTSRILIENIISNLEKTPVDGIVPALKVFDTIHNINQNKVEKTLDRENVIRAQTPQAFLYTKILEAYKNTTNLQNMTDDVSVALSAGLAVGYVTGEETNIKMTTKQDFETQERYVRVGNGFDVHKFSSKPAKHVRLCGVDVEHTHALKGHSDADVGLHALTDALLGAVAEGDIGQHFPPSDPQWKGMDSRFFLEAAAKIIAQKGGSIVNVDVTLICERPKIAPHTTKMRSEIAKCLSIPVERVNVKATTTETLGFTGRQEGIASMATASVLL
jgi:2-C-methyl-D-erythritol 4-phosphate cytidylyltransferase / 2-C-methyl-D-erythritol 2,4-cyclodiphosphate synthase